MTLVESVERQQSPDLIAQQQHVRRDLGGPGSVEQCTPGYERCGSLDSGSALLSSWWVRKEPKRPLTVQPLSWYMGQFRSKINQIVLHYLLKKVCKFRWEDRIGIIRLFGT